MTEEDFIRNHRRINGGNDLPREYLSEINHSVCQTEIRLTPRQGSGFPVMTRRNYSVPLGQTRVLALHIRTVHSAPGRLGFSERKEREKGGERVF
ncbi:hypothetical protein RHMOL_Rhmol08G0080900 [Rhododendron molle]|uniref:Uncharacterized protein n=1 Tax=Rhododendron molle TaxID=49168 RepID=A0ACC0MLQ6_RHOML|nr:hypothetical protein RHMOL_Rhmol08G0080900 [Rhododendron molle]